MDARRAAEYTRGMSAASVEWLLDDLNERQREAVTHRDGPLLVLAGPGSGKTRVITRRAVWLVQQGVWPRQVLAITFTNKAAGEMKSRIAALGVGREMWVYTFHALGARLLREFGSLGRVEPGFTIYDEDDQLRCIKEAMEARALNPNQFRPEQVQAAISAAKNDLRTPAQVLDQAETHEQRALAKAYETYEQLMQDRNAVDFDDLLMRVAIVLRDNAEVADRLNQRFCYLMIDEYQDTNYAQYLIARLLTRTHRNICVTGDPDQGIYAWRGANIGNILSFEQDYPDARVVRLEQNYRSTKAILAVADRLIARNVQRKHKALWTDNPPGDPVELWQFAGDHDEAEQVAQVIDELRAAGRRPAECAIFYRVNALSRGLEDALRRHGIPYQIVRGVAFYQRKEIKDTLAYLRVLVNPADSIALERIINTPPRGIGKTTLNRLRLAADEWGRPLADVLRDADRAPGLTPAVVARIRQFNALLDGLRELASTTGGPGAGAVGELVSSTIARSGLEAYYREEGESGGEDRLANVRELVNAAVAFEQENPGATLEDFLQRTALVSDQDGLGDEGGAAVLMTLHTAKGLEFPFVFLIGLEQGLLPHERSLKRAGDLEEERRLCFVGITRARERLCLSFSSQRLIRGVPTPRAASQFVHEIPDDLVKRRRFQPAFPAPQPAGPRYVTLDEPAGEWTRRRGARGRTRPDDPYGERVFSPDDPTIAPSEPPATGPFDDWDRGMLVRHADYGVGQVEWIDRGGDRVRAGIRFAGVGEKAFVLEFAKLEPLAPGGRRGSRPGRS